MKILLASPRGFCAGVDRAILIVEKALEKYGPPVYVRHEIVHNKYVVEQLKSKGAVFVEETHEIPKGAVGIFSAHGVPKVVYQEAEDRELTAIDATCPLVKKVHKAVEMHNNREREIVLIGHAGHPEVVGTMGQLEGDQIKLVSSSEDVANLEVQDPDKLAYTTQTTLSMQETKSVIDALREKFPNIYGPDKGDLCYATTNRQDAVFQMTEQVDLVLILGSKNSSNSNRLRELAEEHGCQSYLIDGAQDLQKEWFEGIQTVGISSGASAPEILVQDTIDWIQKEFSETTVEDFTILEEDVHFPLPKELRV